MVGEFEQTLLALMIFVIMLGMGASLTPRDFLLALKRPYGLMIGVVSQYGFMPFIGFPPYAAKCEEVAAKGYEGFRLD